MSRATPAVASMGGEMTGVRLDAVTDDERMLPSQFPHATLPASPELDLLAAIVEQAMLDVLRPERTLRGLRWRQDALAWFQSDDVTSFTSFGNVAAVLGIDPLAVRRRLGLTRRAA